MTKLDFVRQLVQMGISIIPLRHRSKEPAIASWEPFKNRPPSTTEYRSWNLNWNNYGVIAGWQDLAFLDFDNMDAFALWLDYFLLLNKHAEVYPMPFIVRTARGAHVYVRVPRYDRVNERRRGVDVKFHGYVVGPGCVHPSGVEYVAMTELRLIEVYSLPTILPDELFPLVAPKPIEIAPAIEIPRMDTQYDPFATASMVQDIDLITRIKQSIRIESLFSGTRRTSVDGRWLAALCPFHDDHNPSLWIDIHRQICGCAVCNFKPMDVINLFARMRGISESVAVSELAREVGVWR